MSVLPFLQYQGKPLLGYFVDVHAGTIHNAVKRLGTISVHGYEMVSLRLNNRSCPHLTHRLVWEHSNGHIPAGFVVDHIDNNKLNNKITNLQLLSMAENSKKAYTSGQRKGKQQPPRPVLAYNLTTLEVKEYSSMMSAANALGIHPYSIQCILQGKSKSSKGYCFAAVEDE